MRSVFKFARSTNSRRTSPIQSRLSFEELEGREVPATLAPINDFTTPNTKALYVPLTVTNTNGTVTYNATSTNSQVQVQVVSGGTTIKLNVTGKDASNNTFTGDLTFRLFDSLAPVTTARILTLVNQGFYNGLTFHRIIDGFVAQGGDPDGNGTGGSGTTIDDEFNTLLTFNSPGLLAMANSGDDTGDSQFFITDTDLTLAQQPEHLNFQHTIFGQLVAGFDTFTKLMSTPVNSPNSGTPLSPVTINSASVVANDPNGVLRVTAPPNFTGTTSITVTPSDSGASTGDSFNVSFVADTRNEPPFLGTIANQTTTVGTGVTFQLTSTDLEGDAVTYSVLGATANGQAISVQSTIDQATGRVTVTPPAAFAGDIQLKVGVKDAGGTNDTQTITLSVTGSFDLDTSSDTGVLNDDNVTATGTPTLTILAPAGQTVNVTVNGTSAGTASPTGTAGQYRITLAANLLRVGANTIAGTAGSTQLTPFTLTYAPSLKSMYVVPGAIARRNKSSARSPPHSRRSRANSVTSRSITPTARSARCNRATRATSRRRWRGGKSSSLAQARWEHTNTISLNGGDIIVLYIVQNNTSANLLFVNPSNSRTGATVAFFSLTGANPDQQFPHVSVGDDPLSSQAVYGFEDLTGGGDRDYNDIVISVRAAGTTPLTTLQVPVGASRSVSLTGELKAAKKTPNGTATTTAGGQVGFFPVDNAAGAIGNLNPGDAGYVAAALGRAQILFAGSATPSTTTNRNVSGGDFLVFYYIPNGTAAQVLASNPTNLGTGSPVAYFSNPTANPDSKVHARSFNPERVTRVAPARPTRSGFT